MMNDFTDEAGMALVEALGCQQNSAQDRLVP
jgi:hypothetical protein